MPDCGYSCQVAVIGAGPAGLMAAEVCSQAGLLVHVFDAMPSVGRKFLMAGKGGLNITHAEPPAAFLSRYDGHAADLQPMLTAFPPAALCAWLDELGIGWFVGTSGRIFPTEMKAAPLLRAWLRRLRMAGVSIHTRHRWQGWTEAEEALQFQTPQGTKACHAQAVVLALGGASWPQLGSTGAWQAVLAARGLAIEPFQPSNCGFDSAWSEHFANRFAGQPVKSVTLALPDDTGLATVRKGEFILTTTGIEGGLVYALSARLREALAKHGPITLLLDLLPDCDIAAMTARLAKPRGKNSLANHLRKQLRLDSAKMGLLRELSPTRLQATPEQLAQLVKALPLTLTRTRPLAEAISSAGGIPFAALDGQLMLKACPGVFCAGEMLDWDAPTGGYLLSACLATGRWAGAGAVAWLGQG